MVGGIVELKQREIERETLTISMHNIFKLNFAI